MPELSFQAFYVVHLGSTLSAWCSVTFFEWLQTKIMIAMTKVTKVMRIRVTSQDPLGIDLNTWGFRICHVLFRPLTILRGLHQKKQTYLFCCAFRSDAHFVVGFSFFVLWRCVFSSSLKAHEHSWPVMFILFCVQFQFNYFMMLPKKMINHVTYSRFLYWLIHFVP